MTKALARQGFILCPVASVKKFAIASVYPAPKTDAYISVLICLPCTEAATLVYICAQILTNDSVQKIPHKSQSYRAVI